MCSVRIEGAQIGLPAAHALIRQAAKEASVVVVYMHAGAEGSAADHVTGHEEYYLGEDRGNPEAFAHLAIDSGASLVIASGPHVLRGIQFWHGHLIAYSLGNFAGYGNFGTDGDLALSAILHVTLSSSGQFERARLYPLQFTGQGGPARARRQRGRLRRADIPGGFRVQCRAYLPTGRHPATVTLPEPAT